MKKVPCLVCFLFGLFLSLFFISPAFAQSVETIVNTGNEPVTFAVLADPHVSIGYFLGYPVPNTVKMYHYNAKIFEDILNTLEKRGITKLIILGDLTKDSETWNHKKMLELLKNFQGEWFVIPGNHDVWKKKMKPGINWNLSMFIKNYHPELFNGKSYYSVPLSQKVLFVGLNTNDPEKDLVDTWGGHISEKQLNWLNKVLNRAKEKWIIIGMHHCLLFHPSPWDKGGMNPNFKVSNAEEVLRVLKKYTREHHIVVFCGHIHTTDIAFSNGIYEVASPSTCTYPLAYRIVTIQDDTIKIKTEWYNNATLREMALREALKSGWNKKSVEVAKGEPWDNNITLIFHSTNLEKASKRLFKVAILPNEIIDKGHVKYDTLNAIKNSDVDFVIFTGDSKDGSSVCSDEVIVDEVKKYFNSLGKPVIYALGDNEWTDCHRTSNGGYDPIERLSLLRKAFFSKPFSQGINPIPVERQGILGDKFSENSRFIYNDIMFIVLDVVGSNNNLVSSEKLCFKKSKRSWKDCEKATEEYKERDKANIEWLKESFDIARKKHLKGVVVIIQADIFTPYDPTYKGYKHFLKHLDEKNGFTNFFKRLYEETHNFDGQVLLVHGDSHVFQFNKPMFDKDKSITANFWRVETFGGKEQSWVKLIINPDDPKHMFTVIPEILPSLKF